MEIKTVAAIFAWIVVALLLLNGMIKSVYLTVLALVLTAVAVLLFFSPRFKKKNVQQKGETETVNA